MKIRTGFVSNSSSSSFIIGLANVKDKAGDFTFDVAREENNWVSPDLPYYLTVRKNKDDEDYKLIMESFTYREVEIDVSVGDNILILDETGSDGDDYFSTDYGDIDYDIDLDEFDGDDIDKYNTIISSGGDAIYGAGRDG